MLAFMLCIVQSLMRMLVPDSANYEYSNFPTEILICLKPSLSNLDLSPLLSAEGKFNQTLSAKTKEYLKGVFFILNLKSWVGLNFF